jgi:hypothetical protein
MHQLASSGVCNEHGRCGQSGHVTPPSLPISRHLTLPQSRSLSPGRILLLSSILFNPAPRITRRAIDPRHRGVCRRSYYSWRYGPYRCVAAAPAAAINSDAVNCATRPRAMHAGYTVSSHGIYVLGPHGSPTWPVADLLTGLDDLLITVRVAGEYIVIVP